MLSFYTVLWKFDYAFSYLFSTDATRRYVFILKRSNLYYFTDYYYDGIGMEIRSGCDWVGLGGSPLSINI